jgi:hypothetical protein
MPPQSVTNLPLSALKEGAVEEHFQHAMRQVVDNVLDPNTSAEGKRTITITATFMPKGDRTAMLADLKVVTKLCGPEPIKTLLMLKPEGHEYVAVEPEQARIPGLIPVAEFKGK